MISEELRRKLIESKEFIYYNKNIYCNLVDRILKDNDIKLKDEDGWTLLHYAVRDSLFGNLYNLVKLFLTNGIDVNNQTDVGFTSLIVASRSNEIEIVKLLLEYGADTQIKDNFGLTALDYAKNYYYLDIVELLEQYDKRSNEELEDLEEEVKRLIRQ